MYQFSLRIPGFVMLMSSTSTMLELLFACLLFLIDLRVSTTLMNNNYFISKTFCTMLDWKHTQYFTIWAVTKNRRRTMSFSHLIRATIANILTLNYVKLNNTQQCRTSLRVNYFSIIALRAIEIKVSIARMKF